MHSDYLVALKALTTVFKISIDTGKVLEEIKNRAIEHLYDLGLPYVLADAPVGKMFAIDTRDMTIFKKYGNKIVNPSNCSGMTIRDAILKDNVLSITGDEMGPPKGGTFEGRVIDTAFC